MDIAKALPGSCLGVLNGCLAVSRGLLRWYGGKQGIGEELLEGCEDVLCGF